MMIINNCVAGLCVYETYFLPLSYSVFLLLMKKFIMKQWAILCQQQHHTSHVYSASYKVTSVLAKWPRSRVPTEFGYLPHQEKQKNNKKEK
jgi:hypothetical protein